MHEMHVASLVRWKCPPLGRAALGGAEEKNAGGGGRSGHGCFAVGGRTPAQAFRRRGSKSNYFAHSYPLTSYCPPVDHLSLQLERLRFRCSPQ